jgi:vacuolar-type H+-ATPase subunit F/Vma7
VNAVLLGDVQDARGFALAGFAAVPCGDVREAESALRRVAAAPDLALVLVSPGVAALVPEALDAFRARAAAPVVLVLP